MKQTTNSNELVKLMSQQDEPFQVFSAPISTSYKVIIDDEFREVYQFTELVDALDSATDKDCFLIKLSTVGGALHACIPLIAALKNTEAYVHVHVESDCASAGTFIMMLADSCFVNEYASVMFHNVQFGAVGHGGNVAAHVDHTTKMSQQLVRDMYSNFLTEDEITQLLHGMEIYFDADECHKRFQDREEILQAQYDSLEEAIVEQEAQSLIETKPKRKPKA